MPFRKAHPFAWASLLRPSTSRFWRHLANKGLSPEEIASKRKGTAIPHNRRRSRCEQQHDF